MGQHKKVLPQQFASDEAREAAVCRWYREGWTVAGICRETGYDTHQIYKILKQNKVPYRLAASVLRKRFEKARQRCATDGRATKVCTKCKTEKPPAAFGRCSRRDHLDGLSVVCRDCYRIRRREHMLTYRPKTTRVVNDKRCPRCKQTQPATAFDRYCKSTDGLAGWCKRCTRACGKARTQEVKRQVVTGYGGKCECCGEQRIEFLCIDHINGGGHKDRSRHGSGVRFYTWLISQNFPRKELRLLCHNCNCARGYYGYCPHERERTPS